MIGVLIKYKEKIMFAGLPKDSISLENQLSRIGLDVYPHEINLTSNNNYGYEIEIYGQDSAEIAICARICSSDTLGQLNKLMQYLDNNEVDDLYEVVVDGDSESIAELYKEITTPPELETTDNGQGLSLVPGVDSFHVISQEESQSEAHDMGMQL